MRQWVAKEDEFVVKQSRKKAKIRVKEGRAKPIDWLAVTLTATDEFSESLEDEDERQAVEVMDPCSLIEAIDPSNLRDLETDIDAFLSLETNHVNRTYWNVCIGT